MTDQAEPMTRKALAAYAEALRDVRPSAHLDARIEAAIREGSGKRFNCARRQAVLRWLAAAASVAAIALGLLLLTRDARDGASAEMAQAPSEIPAAVDESKAFSVVSPAHYSLWPTDAEVFRVRASLGAAGAAMNSANGVTERQFWVDVRIANDGSMRIVRIVPADGGEWLAQ